MKLEVEMYVRTKRGYIYKLSYYEEEEKRWICVEENDWYPVYESDVSKSSNSIIDLIQVGDYVNGDEVMEADWINANGEYEEGLAFPMYASDDLDVIENWLPLRSVPIKSIVTKEQFLSMEYKVGEQ